MDAFEFLEDLNTLKVAPKPWMVSGEYRLVLATAEMLPRIVDECIASGLYGADLETTGLDRRVFNGETVDRIVGACLSPDGRVGYYIPVRHKVGLEHNVPWSVFVREMKRLVASPARAVFHNGKFDQEFLQFNGTEALGEWDDPKKWEDTLILAYLRDTRAKNKGLKHLAKTELGMEMIELEELFPEERRKSGELDFSELDPSWEPVTWYGGADGLCTRKLYDVLAPPVLAPNDGIEGQGFIYSMEKLCVAGTRWMERARILTDQEKAFELIRLGQREWIEALREVYESAGKLLGRDIRPGYFRLMTGEVEGTRECFFDVEAPTPPYMNRIEDARTKAAELKLDAPHPDRKGKLATLSKRVPALTAEAKGTYEEVEFPLVYDVLSPQQLGSLLRECGVPGLKVTEKSGQVATGSDDIEAVLEEAGDKFPFAGKIKRFREVKTALSTFLTAIVEDKGPDNTLAFQFNAFSVETGRFSVSACRNPKRDGGTSLPLHGLPATYDKSRPECLLRLRECIIARPGKFIVACVARGEYVHTVRGHLPIEEVRFGDRVITDEGPKNVRWAGKTGTKEVVRVTLDKGISLRLTPDHRVQIVGEGGFEWKKAGSLRPGDWVVQSFGDCEGTTESLPGRWKGSRRAEVKVHPIRFPETMTAELAEFLGRFMGDGCLTGSKGKLSSVQFSLGSDLEELLPKLNKSSERLFGVSFRHSKKGDVGKSSRLLAEWLEAVTRKGSRDVRTYEVPPCVMRSSSSIQGAFLRGLFDADGSVGKTRDSGISLWVTSERMSAQVQLLLAGLGIACRRERKSFVTNYGPHTGHEMSIYGNRSIRIFRDRVGFSTFRKKIRLEALVSNPKNRDYFGTVPYSVVKKAIVRGRNLKTGATVRNARRSGRATYEALRNCLPYPEDLDLTWTSKLLEGNVFFDVVRSVEPDGESEVYDLNIPEGSRFSVSSVVTHNCDFSGVELRIATNLSREPKWLREFFHCSTCDRMFPGGEPGITPPPPPPYCPDCGGDKIGDLHTLTGISLFGEEATKGPDWKQQRQTAKIINFLLVYGGSGSAVQRTTGCDKNEGFRIQDQFVRTYRVLKGWWDEQHKFAREHRFVLTAFGRRYPVPDILHEERYVRSKGERNAVNGPVQGCLHPDARILTSEGLRTVKELWDRQQAGGFPEGFRVWTGVAWARARALYSGQKKVRETIFDRGLESKTSPEHLFRTWGENGFEWTPQDELRPGTWVAANAPRNVDWETPEYSWNPAPRTRSSHRFERGMTPYNAKQFRFSGNSETLWEFLGMVYGDGSITDTSFSVVVGGNRNYPEFSAEAHCREWADRLNRELGAGAIVQALALREGTTKLGEPFLPKWNVAVFNRSFRDFCRERLGVETQITYTKRFPNAIWNETATNRAAFLRGYFSTDGTSSLASETSSRVKDGKTYLRHETPSFSVGSINHGLLRDTRDLLATLGIRSSYLPRSYRVDVIDREVFRVRVGFNLPYKTARAAELRVGAYFYQRHALPPSLVREVGRLVHSSPVYRGLGDGGQSAVLRLVAGSGSRHSCRKYVSLLSPEEVPDRIRKALEYDYVRVRESKDLGTEVEMYDIEVFDEEHAFVADGVVTHNTSADITKLAMGLIYRECKKRGWLDRVHMLITMHDELVFEIDGDILEEAIDTFVGIMNRNPALLKLGWPVPLTSDVEIGFSWAVPWDLKKIRKTGEVPPELAGCFSGTKVLSAEEKKAKEAAKKQAEATKKVRVFRIGAFTLGEVEALSALLNGGGDAELRLEGPNGEDLTALFAAVLGEEIPRVAAS